MLATNLHLKNTTVYLNGAKINTAGNITPSNGSVLTVAYDCYLYNSTINNYGSECLSSNVQSTSGGGGSVIIGGSLNMRASTINCIGSDANAVSPVECTAGSGGQVLVDGNVSLLAPSSVNGGSCSVNDVFVISGGIIKIAGNLSSRGEYPNRNSIDLSGGTTSSYGTIGNGGQFTCYGSISGIKLNMYSNANANAYASAGEQRTAGNGGTFTIYGNMNSGEFNCYARGSNGDSAGPSYPAEEHLLYMALLVYIKHHQLH